MLKCFIFALFTISTAQAFTCGKSQVQVQTEKKVRVDQEIQVQKDWMDLDKKITIHSGNITALRLFPEIEADKIVLNWIGVTKEIVLLKEGENLKYNLGKSFDKNYKKAKYLEFTVYHQKEKICRQKIALIGGD